MGAASSSWHSRRLFALAACFVSLIGNALAADHSPRSIAPDDLAQYDALIGPEQREHWSFQPVVRHPVPAVTDTPWPQNPIDNFILSGLESTGWTPSPDVDRGAWLRRVYLDVTGMPPTPEEQARFAADSSHDAFERVVDDLLSRPEYGERWARHWLDLVRFAETNGYERDAIKPSVWRYRDYVISALNDDKPFDRFTLEQLAGDELPDASGETLIATGYYRLGPWDDEPADFPQDRADQLDDMVSTTSRVFLGLTLGCSRCHNHKFDPLTMHDYYRMVAVFDPMQRPQEGRTELDRPAGSPAERAALTDRDRKIEVLKKQISVLPAEAKQRASEFEQAILKLQAGVPDLPRGYFMQEVSPQPPETHLLSRGRASAPGPVVQPGMPAVLVSQQPKFLSPDQASTRRRLTLAKWIADADNPLTSRVIVNRVWQFHFGEGLVSTSSDFGTLGTAPTHPELLDWLAHWFTHDAQWSLKRLHRLILTSRTYRMSKQSNPEYAAADPENQRLWRFPYRRLEVEAIRDSMLAASGRLNNRMYGESVYLSVPKEALAGHSDPGQIWKPFNEDDDSRRTVYAFIKRSMVVPMLEVLDLCDTTRSSEKRQITSVPTQALTLFNGEFVNRQSQHFAERLRREAGDEPHAEIRLAYRLALCRAPRDEEVIDLTRFLHEESAKSIAESSNRPERLSPEEGKRAALTQMCRVIFNLNEFVYAD